MSKTRSQALPDVPTIIEAGYPGLDGEGWDGIFVPAGTPPDIIALLSDQTRNVLALPDVAQRIDALGFSSVGVDAGRLRQRARGRKPDLGQGDQRGRSQAEVTALARRFYFFGGIAANFEPRTHMRPRGSCHRRSVWCR